MINLANFLTTNNDNIAIIDENNSYSYNNIHEKSNSLASGLLKFGVKKYDKVGIKFYNSFEFLISYLAVLKVGATAVLINPITPMKIGIMLEEKFDLKVIIQRFNIHEFLGETKSIDVSLKTEDPAFIVFSSGSTDIPKSIVVPHNHLWMIEKLSKIRNWTNVKMLLASPCCHMSGLSYLETGLAGGSQIILMSRFVPEKAIDLIVKNEINFLPFVPSMMTMLLDSLGDRSLDSVKVIRLSSAPVNKKLIDRIKGKLPNARVSIGYGSSEGGPNLFGPHHSLPTPELSVGYPVDGIDYRIVNEVLEIKSPSMMIGYGNSNTTLTEDGYFVTNDIFHIDENGFYYFIGRADDMFTCGGHNIYPSHIERILEQHPEVINSSVIGIPDDIKGHKPFAFVTGKAKETELKRHCRQYLTPAQIPRKIWNIDHIPLNNIGKIDKQKLKEQAIKLLYNV